MGQVYRQANGTCFRRLFRLVEHGPALEHGPVNSTWSSHGCQVCLLPNITWASYIWHGSLRPSPILTWPRHDKHVDAKGETCFLARPPCY